MMEKLVGEIAAMIYERTVGEYMLWDDDPDIIAKRWEVETARRIISRIGRAHVNGMPLPGEVGRGFPLGAACLLIALRQEEKK